jgi:hypothetical protein
VGSFFRITKVEPGDRQFDAVAHRKLDDDALRDGRSEGLTLSANPSSDLQFGGDGRWRT